jgi:hypothetical protein
VASTSRAPNVSYRGRKRRTRWAAKGRACCLDAVTLAVAISPTISGLAAFNGSDSGHPRLGLPDVPPQLDAETRNRSAHEGLVPRRRGGVV